MGSGVYPLLPSGGSALTNGAAIPGLETALVSCLERIFVTKYGSSLIPHYMVKIFVWSFLLYLIGLFSVITHGGVSKGQFEDGIY